MAKAPLTQEFSDEDKSQFHQAAAALGQSGVELREPTNVKPRSTPSHTEEGWSARGRARDLTVEKDNQPEVIRQGHTSWGNRLKAQLARSDERSDTSQTQEGTAASPDDRSKAPATPGSQENATPAASPSKAGWVDRGKGNEPRGEHNEESTAEKANSAKAKASDRQSAKSHEHER